LQIFKVFDYFRFRQKGEAWLSIVAENATLNLALFSLLWVFGSFSAFFGKKAELDFAFLAKVRS
jgi:hypothetical protein